MSAEKLDPEEPTGPGDQAGLSPGLRRGLMDGCLAFSLANLLLVHAWFPLLFDKDHGYFNKLRVEAPTLLALLFNLAWMSLVFWFVIGKSRRTPHRWLRALIHLSFFALLLIPVDFIRSEVLKIPDFQLVLFVRRPVVTLLGGLLMLLLIWRHRLAARWAGDLVGILTPLALLTLGHVLLLLTGVTRLSQHTAEPALQPLQPLRPEMPRVVWIVFDELDYRLVFEQRPAGLALPEFDRLRAEGLSATQAYPPGGYTLISMPALISGRSIAGVHITAPSELLLDLEGSHERVPWSGLPSVFSRARELGANTGLVGWYHPYSRILANSLSYCVWFPYPASEPARAATFLAAVGRELLSTGSTFNLRRIYGQLCREIVGTAEALAGDANFNLLLLHLAPPHKPGVYLPAEDRFTMFGMRKTVGYFNNVALADRAIGRIRRSVERHGLEGKTWYIVSTDHWWRESEVYDRKVDFRIPFLVRAPGAPGGRTFDGMINTGITQDLLLAVLRNEVRSLDDVSAWLARHRVVKPPAYGQQHESAD